MAKKPVTKTTSYRAMPEYRDGVEAYREGRSVDDHDLDKAGRNAFMTGWYDARTRDRLGHIFQRYGMTWP